MSKDRCCAVAKAAKEWIAHLEAAGGRYLDGVPGDLMDALEELDDGKVPCNCVAVIHKPECPNGEDKCTK